MKTCKITIQVEDQPDSSGQVLTQTANSRQTQYLDQIKKEDNSNFKTEREDGQELKQDVLVQEPLKQNEIIVKKSSGKRIITYLLIIFIFLILLTIMILLCWFFIPTGNKNKYSIPEKGYIIQSKSTMEVQNNKEQSLRSMQERDTPNQTFSDYIKNGTQQDKTTYQSPINIDLLVLEKNESQILLLAMPSTNIDTSDLNATNEVPP